MRIVVAAVGRLKQGPERELAERYRKRAADAGRSVGLNAFDIVEIKESRADDAARRRLEESIAIANIVPDGAVSGAENAGRKNVPVDGSTRPGWPTTSIGEVAPVRWLMS